MSNQFFQNDDIKKVTILVIVSKALICVFKRCYVPTDCIVAIVCFLVMSGFAFICTVLLSRNVVILAVFISLPYKLKIWLAIKQVQPTICFLKCPSPCKEYCSCYQIVRFYVFWRLFL